jgi:hypothetical protein
MWENTRTIQSVLNLEPEMGLRGLHHLDQSTVELAQCRKLESKLPKYTELWELFLREGTPLVQEALT